MNCGRDDCTGVHDGNIPYAQWCEGFKKQRLAWRRRSGQVEGTYAYRAAHGIGEAGEKKRVRDTRYANSVKGFDRGQRLTRKRRVNRIAERMEELHG